ncbi:MAG: hypothetical protein EZS28_021736, partial [Streblomastix strix]
MIEIDKKRACVNLHSVLPSFGSVIRKW